MYSPPSRHINPYRHNTSVCSTDVLSGHEYCQGYNTSQVILINADSCGSSLRVAAMRSRRRGRLVCFHGAVVHRLPCRAGVIIVVVRGVAKLLGDVRRVVVRADILALLDIIAHQGVKELPHARSSLADKADGATAALELVICAVDVRDAQHLQVCTCRAFQGTMPAFRRRP